MASISFEDLIPSKQTSQILSFDDLIPGNKAGVLSDAPLPRSRPAEFVSAEAPTSEANAYNFEDLIPKAQPEAQPEPSMLAAIPGGLEAKLGVQNTLLGITEQGSQKYQRMQQQLEEAKARGASPDYISSLERQLSLFQNKPEAVEAQRLESLPAILQTEAEIAKQPKTEFSQTVSKAQESGNLTDLASGVYEGIKQDPLGALKELTGAIVSSGPVAAATVAGGPIGGGLYAQGEGFGRALVEETIKRSPDPEGIRRQIESGDVTAFNEIYKSNQKEIEEAARNQGIVSGAFGTAFGFIPGSKTFLGGVAKNLSVYAPLEVAQTITENKITQVPQINAETGKPKLDANGKVILVDAADMSPSDIAVAYGIGIATGIPFEAMHFVKGKGAEATPATGPQKPAAGPEAPTGGPEAPTGGPEAPAGGPEATAGDKDAAMNDFMDKFYKFASKDDGMLMSAFEEDIAKGRITREEAIDRIAQLTPEEAAEKAKLFAQVGGDQVKGATLSREDFDAIAAKRKANRPEAPEAQPSPESTVETPGPESAPAPGVPLNEAEILKGMGYDIEDIVAMSPSERKAEVADAVANKVTPAPLTPEESAILSPAKAAQAQPKAAQAQPKPAPEQPKAAQTPPPKPTEAPSAVAEEMVKQGVDPLAAMKQAASGEQAAGGAYNRLRAAGYSDEQISGMTLEQRLNAPIPAAKAADEGPVAGKPVSEEDRLMKEFQDNWQAEQDAQRQAEIPVFAPPVAEALAPAPEAPVPAPEAVTTPAPSPIQQPPAPKVAVIKGEYNKKTKQFEIRRFDPEGKAIDEMPAVAGQPAEGRSIVADFQKEHPEAAIEVIPSLTPREGEVIVGKKIREAPRRTLRQYITYLGGINDVGHEVVGVKNRKHPGLVRTDGRGMSLEDAFKSAVGDGFYPEFAIQLENNKQYGEAKFDYDGMLDTFVNDLQKNEQTYRAQDKDKKVQEAEQDAWEIEYESRAKERQGLRLSLEGLGIEIDENILDDAISIRLGRDIGDYEAYELATLGAIAKDPSIAKSEIQDIVGEDYWNAVLSQQEERNEEQRPYEYEAEPQTMEGGDEVKPQPTPEAVPAPREEGQPAERPEKKTAAEEPSKDIEKPVEPRAQGEVTLVDKKRVNLGFAEGYVTRLELSNGKKIDIYREPLEGRGTLAGWNYRNSDDLGPAGTGWESVKHTYIGENLEEAIQQVLKDQTSLDAKAASPVNAKSLPKTDPEKTLVLIACGAKKKEDGKAHSLYNLYEGPMWQTLRLNIGDIPKENVLVLSAHHGLSRSDKPSMAYDEQLTPKRADEIIGNGIKAEISSFLKGKEFDSVIIAGSGEYRRVFYQIANLMKNRGDITPDAMIVETTGGIGEQRGQFGEYLNQVNQKPAKEANVPESKAEPAEPSAKGKEIPGTGLSIEKKLLPSLSLKNQAKKIDYVLSKYFAPGNIVDSYGGGKDKVISFDKKGDDWSVTVQKVTPEGLGQTRTHRTLPDKNELAKILGKDYNKDWVVTGDLTKNKFLLDALGFEPMRTVDGIQQRIFIGENPTQKIADAVAPKPAAPVEVKLGNEPPDQVGVVKFDQVRGYGSVPDNQNVDYKGFVVMMKPEAYLALAKAGVKKGSKERAEKIIIAGKPIGSPFLDVDFSGLTPRVVGHDGRHRMMAIEELQPNVAVPVHIFGANGLRAKNITSSQIEDFKTKALNEDKKLVALFPNFGSYFHMGKLVEEEAKTKFIGNEDIPKIQKMLDAKLRPGYKARLAEKGKGVFIDMPGVKNPLYLQIMEDIPSWIDGLIRLVPEEARTPVAEKGAEGKPQLVIPGAEKIGMGELAQRKSEEALKPKVAQKEPGGLFGDDSKQADLMDIINKPEPAKAEKPEPVVQKPKAPVILNSFKDIVANKEQFSKSANVSDEYFNVMREWAEMLGMKTKIHMMLITDGAAFDFGKYKKPPMWKKESTQGSNTWLAKEKISVLTFRFHPRKSYNLETIAHELGHAFNHEVWESSSKAEKDAVMADYRRFLTENKVKNVEDYVKALRPLVTGKITEISPSMRRKLASKTLKPYWRSFDEYFADQVAKYMMSEARPQSIIGKFFGRIADALKRLYNSLAGMQGKARKSMKDYIERRMKTDDGVTSAAEKVVDDAFEEPITNESRSFDEDTINEMNELNKKYGMERDEKPSSTDVVIPESKMDAFRRLTQDEFLYQRRIQEYIESSSGAPLPEAADAYARVNLMPGRTSERMANLERDEVVPLVERMKALDVSLDELGKYLYAHHALERNAVMAQRDPKRFAIDGGSGLADGAAKEIIKQFDSRKKEMEELADMVYAINKRDLERRVESGLYSQEQADELTSLYKRYVPLRGFAEREADEQHKMQYQMGRGVSVSKKETESAFGRTSIANNPLMNVILQAEEGVYRVEKNRAARALLLLAKSVPNKNLWTVNKPKLHKELGVDGVVKWVVDGVTGPNTVVAKVGGVPYYIDLKHPGLAEAYKKIGVTAMAKPMRVITQIGRFYSQLHTGRNPAFMAVNILRDVAAAQNYAISVDPQVGKNFPLAFPQAMKIAIQAARGKMSDKDKAIYDEWRMAGGKISYNSFKDVESLSKELRELLGETNPLSWSTLPAKTKQKALGVFKKILHGLDKISQPSEDAARLATYIAARKVKNPNAPAGLKPDDPRNFKYSIEQAARFAQEATVNFFRKGKYTPWINGLYMFFNASLQGAFTGAKLLKNFKRARRVYAALFPIGFMIGINNLLMSDDDEAEKGRKNYMNVPEWEKANSIVIKTGPGPKDYFRIPFPKWFLAPYTMGEQLAMAATGQKGVWDSAVQAGTNVIDAVNPFGTNSPLSLLSPTLLDPITDIYTNRTFTGSPIHPEPQKWNQGIPRSEQKFSTTSPTATAFSKWVYSWSKGAVDIYPGDAEYVYKWMFGGLGQNVGNAGAWANNTMDGKETKIESIPIIKAFVPSGWNESSRYYELKNKFDEKANQIRKAGKSVSDNPLMSGISRVVNNADKIIKEKREKITRIENNKALKPQEKQRQQEQAKQEMYRAMISAERSMIKIAPTPQSGPLSFMMK